MIIGAFPNNRILGLLDRGYHYNIGGGNRSQVQLYYSGYRFVVAMVVVIAAFAHKNAIQADLDCFGLGEGSDDKSDQDCRGQKAFFHGEIFCCGNDFSGIFDVLQDGFSEPGSHI